MDIKTEIPKESSGRLLDALTDIIRPFSEKRGLRADQIRLQREETLLEIARRARLRAEVEALRLRPVPNKFLVPLLEKASNEELDSPLLEWWAHLLVSALDTEISSRPFFSDLIAKMGPHEAQFLEDLWKRFAVGDLAGLDDNHIRGLLTQELEQRIGEALARVPDRLTGDPWRTSAYEELRKLGLPYVETLDGMGCVVRRFRIPDGEGYHVFSSPLPRDNITALHVCKALEILEDFHIGTPFNVMGLAGREYSATITLFTQLGQQFMHATHRVSTAPDWD